MNKTKNEKLEETYPLNAITVHPQSGTFATAGADGRVCYWDKDNRTTLGPKVPKPEYGKPLNPVTACKVRCCAVYLQPVAGQQTFGCRCRGCFR